MQPALKAPPTSLRPLKPQSRSPKRWVRLALIAIVIWFLVVVLDSHIWPNRYLVPWVFGEGIYQVQTAEKLVALTFDDGPDPRYTEEISHILAAAGARSTFFVVGKHAVQYPHLIQTLIQDGHEVGNHTWNHASLQFKSRQRIRTELETTDRLLRELGYQDPILFRSPYGHSLLGLPRILRQRQQANILWTVQLNDWRPDPPDIMMDLLEPAFDKGAIILLHDGDGESEWADRSNTVEVVKRILAKYQPQGYRFVTVSELLASGQPQRHQ